MQLYKNTTECNEVVFIIYISLGFLPSCSLCSLASRQLGKGATQVKLGDLVKNTTEYNEVVFIYYYSWLRRMMPPVLNSTSPLDLRKCKAYRC